MNAVAVDPAKREVRLVSVSEPDLVSPSSVKLRMREVGICGTDREICAFEYGTPPRGETHLVIGHESLGEVVEVGSGVSTVRPGDLVVPMVRRPCPHDHCPACRSGRQDFCYTGDFRERGIREAHGFLAEQVVDEETYMVPVPRELADVAVLVEPLTIAEKALAQIWQVQGRLPWACPSGTGANGGSCHRAVVLGAGPVGLLGAMALVAAGFETTVYSRDVTTGPKAVLTRSFGARYVSSAETPPAALAEEIGNIDVVFEAVGLSPVAFDLVPHLGVNGLFVFTGVPAQRGPIQIDTDLLMRNLVLKNQVVLGTVNAGRETFEAAIRDLGVFRERWPEALRSLITGRFPIDAHEDLLRGRSGGIKNVISFA